MNGTLLIALLIIGIISLIIWAFVVHSHKMKKKTVNEMVQVYEELITRDHLTIIQEEKLTNRILALDPIKKVFVFVFNFGQPAYDIVKLDNSVICEITKTINKIPLGKSSPSRYDKHVSAIYLSFKAKGVHLMDVPTYIEIHDGTAEKKNLEILTEEWQKKINQAASV